MNDNFHDDGSPCNHTPEEHEAMAVMRELMHALITRYVTMAAGPHPVTGQTCYMAVSVHPEDMEKCERGEQGLRTKPLAMLFLKADRDLMRAQGEAAKNTANRKPSEN